MKYNETVQKHFKDPRNVGEIENADFTEEIFNPTCGDTIKVWGKVDNGKLTDIKYKVLGCAAAVASASMMSIMVKGKKIEEILKMTDDDVVRALGGLPSEKLVCSSFAMTTLKKGLNQLPTDNSQQSTTTSGDVVEG